MATLYKPTNQSILKSLAEMRLNRNPTPSLSNSSHNSMATTIAPSYPYTRGNFNGQIAIVGECGGIQEQKAVQKGLIASAFVGWSGGLLNTLLTKSNIPIDDCYFTNVCKVFTNNITEITEKNIATGLNILFNHELNLMSNLKMIITLGNLAVYGVTGNIDKLTFDLTKTDPSSRTIKQIAGIMKLRGSILPSTPIGPNNRTIKTIVCMHPALLHPNRAPKNLLLMEYDLARAKLESEDSINNVNDNQDPFSDYDLIVNPTLNDVEDYVHKSLLSPNLATDVENIGGQMTCLSLSSGDYEDKSSICVPFFHPKIEGSYWKDPKDEMKVYRLLRKLLSTHKGHIGQYYHHDLYHYHHYGLIDAVNPVFDGLLVDTYMAHMALIPPLPHDLNTICSIYLRHRFYKDDLKAAHKDEKQSSNLYAFAHEDIQTAYWKYSALDGIVTKLAGLHLIDELKKINYWDFYVRNYNNLLPHLLKTMIRGIRVNPSVLREGIIEERNKLWDNQVTLQELIGKSFYVPKHTVECKVVSTSPELKLEALEASQTTLTIIPYSSLPPNPINWKDISQIKSLYFNCTSPLQTLKILKNLGESCIDDIIIRDWRDLSKKTTARRAIKTLDSTGKKILSNLRLIFENTKLQTAIDLILKIRKSRTLLSNFLLKEMGTIEGRFNFTLKTGTITGRLASTRDPFGKGGNSENLPDGLVRRSLTADPGCALIYIDLSNAEARAVAYVAQVARMMALFSGEGDRARDFHTMQASALFGVPYDGVVYELRQLGKMTGHAINYRVSPTTLAATLNIPLPKITEVYNLYKGRYPEIFQWHRDVEAQIRKTRMLISPFGRRLSFIGDLNNPNTVNSAIASVPQSICPDLLNISLIRLSEKGYYILNQCHDALLVQCIIDEVPQVCEVLRKELERPIKINGYDVVIPTDSQVGLTWDGKTRDREGNIPFYGLRSLEQWNREYGEGKWDKFKVEGIRDKLFGVDIN